MLWIHYNLLMIQWDKFFFNADSIGNMIDSIENIFDSLQFIVDYWLSLEYMFNSMEYIVVSVNYPKDLMEFMFDSIEYNEEYVWLKHIGDSTKYIADLYYIYYYCWVILCSMEYMLESIIRWNFWVS